MSTKIAGLDNTTIAAWLDEYAALLELAGAGYYTSRAYRRAAEVIRGTPAPIDELVRTGRVRDLHGIGPGIEQRLRELVETGKLAELDELKQTVSVELAALGRLIGVDTRRAAEIGRTLGITTVDEFRAAAKGGRLREVPGIGPKTEARIRRALERDVQAPARPLLINRARALVERIAGARSAVSRRAILDGGWTTRSNWPSWLSQRTCRPCAESLQRSRRSSHSSARTSESRSTARR